MDTSCFLNTSYNGPLLGWQFENFQQRGKCCLLPSQIVNDNYCMPSSTKSGAIGITSFHKKLFKNCPEGMLHSSIEDANISTIF